MNTVMTQTNQAAALWIDDKPVPISEVLEVLCLTKQIPALIRELALNHALADVHLPQEREDELLSKFRRAQQLDSEESFLDFLQKNHLNETWLRRSLSRPERVVRFREERWGPRANSLYLKHKDRYDLITYRRLQSNNADVMQEVYFRLKDREETWESLARQFPGAKPAANAQVGPIPVNKVEPVLLDMLRKTGPGIIIRPLRIGNNTVVAELEQLEASRFDNELRTQILRDEFETWLEEEYAKMLNQLRLAE